MRETRAAWIMKPDCRVSRAAEGFHEPVDQDNGVFDVKLSINLFHGREGRLAAMMTPGHGAKAPKKNSLAKLKKSRPVGRSLVRKLNDLAHGAIAIVMYFGTDSIICRNLKRRSDRPFEVSII